MGPRPPQTVRSLLKRVALKTVGRGSRVDGSRRLALPRRLSLLRGCAKRGAAWRAGRLRPRRCVRGARREDAAGAGVGLSSPLLAAAPCADCLVHCRRRRPHWREVSRLCPPSRSRPHRVGCVRPSHDGRAGRAKARPEDRTLSFVDRLEDAPAAQVLLASGLMQYLDTPLADLIRRMRMLRRSTFF